MEAAPVAMREKQQEEISFATKPREVSSSKNWMLGALLVFVLCTAGAVVYFMTRDSQELPVTENNLLLTDTAAATVTDTNTIRRADTARAVVDSVSRMPAPSSDGFSFKVVLKEYPTKIAADKAFEKLTAYGHKLVLTQKDSGSFKISMPFTTPLSDTLRAKDSLKRFFGGKPYI
jgi:hypothetical protein